MIDTKSVWVYTRKVMSTFDDFMISHATDQGGGEIRRLHKRVQELEATIVKLKDGILDVRSMARFSDKLSMEEIASCAYAVEKALESTR